MTALSAMELAAVARQLSGAGIRLAGPLSSTAISGGRSNLTFRITDGSSAWVLRMPPRAGRTPSAHDVARELRVTSALRGTEVPVAPAVLLCEDESVLGAPFAVAGFVRGRTIQTRAHLDAVDDETLGALTTCLLEVLAALHKVDHRAVGLEGFGRPDGYAARQVRRWTQQWEIVGTPEHRSAAGALAERLAAAVPEQRVTSIVHGDYRIDNTLVRLEDRPPRIAAVVDWELSTIGDPVADVATMCAYRDPAFDLVLGSPSAWTSPRLPDVDALAAAYESAGGVTLNDWDFHLALACFKVAVIAAGIDHRRRAGAGEGPGFDTAGEAVGPYLERGLSGLVAVR
jgi:aminoglycoside phosphotransferase (APT) family kinase protein